MAKFFNDVGQQDHAFTVKKGSNGWVMLDSAEENPKYVQRRKGCEWWDRKSFFKDVCALKVYALEEDQHSTTPFAVMKQKYERKMLNISKHFKTESIDSARQSRNVNPKKLTYKRKGKKHFTKQEIQKGKSKQIQIQKQP